MTFKTYKKRPVDIMACQFNGSETHAYEITDYINQKGHNASVARDHFGTYIYINTLEGVMKGDAGDYIIQGIEGEFYPCKPAVFEGSYDQV